MMKRMTMLVVALTCGCSGAAASGAKEPRQFQDTALNGAAQRPAEPAMLKVSKDIRDACGLAESSAFFAYDSSHVTARDATFFRSLADCFVAGPLQGRAMRLVGHADPRGETDYNYVLGQRRADGVRAAVIGAGLAASRVSTTSRGELEARGEDEASFAQDRRVDIVLGES